MKTRYKMPYAVRLALEEVRKHFPDVCMVLYGPDLRWMFMEEDMEAPEGDFVLAGVDVSLLEDAADSVPHCPIVYHVNDEDDSAPYTPRNP